MHGALWVATWASGAGVQKGLACRLAGWSSGHACRQATAWVRVRGRDMQESGAAGRRSCARKEPRGWEQFAGSRACGRQAGWACEKRARYRLVRNIYGLC